MRFYGPICPISPISPINRKTAKPHNRKTAKPQNPIIMKKLVFVLVSIFISVSAFAQEQLPYQNPRLSAQERAADLCSRLTLEEKAKLMLNSSPAIERLGIPAFEWWSECLHGVARNGYATMFPSCIGMAASFNDELLYDIYSAASDEGRAKYTANRKAGKTSRYMGISYWTPNINIFRDPRWGRGQETYGEDPYQNGRMGSIVVKGLQGTALNANQQPQNRKTAKPQNRKTAKPYYKAYACAKHFAVHSGPESTRHHLNLDNISPRDLWETYMPAFKTLVQDAGVKEVMCAYQRLDGEPCCGNNRLLTDILRKEWGYQGVVVSDCGAIRDFYQQGHHEVSPNPQAAAGKAVLAGTDVNCGSVYKNLPQAVKDGYIKESDIDVSIKRILEARFELGDFDPDEMVGWTNIPASCIASQEHKQLSLQMARETIVLLQNKKNALPLNRDDKFLLMGPNAADSIMLWGIYYGQPTHSVTIKEGIENKIGTVPYYKACELVSFNESATKYVKKVTEYGTDKSIDEARNITNNFSIESCIEAAKDFNTIVFVGGISPIVEREEAGVDLPGFKGGDRTSIELPQVQRDILQALHKAGKKIIFINCSGSAVALTPETETCDAILQIWYPGEQGGNAVADVLFGDYNPSGKLPVTFYKDDSVLGDFEDYSMSPTASSTMKGKTYRYFTGDALFPFGYGLSYTKFKIKSVKLDTANDRHLTVTISNTGKHDGTEVVQLYMRCPDDPDGPIKTLRGYQRVSIKAGETKTVTIPVPEKTFERFDTHTNTMRVMPGNYELLCGTSSRPQDLKVIKVKL